MTKVGRVRVLMVYHGNEIDIVAALTALLLELNVRHLWNSLVEDLDSLPIHTVSTLRGNHRTDLLASLKSVMSRSSLAVFKSFQASSGSLSAT